MRLDMGEPAQRAHLLGGRERQSLGVYLPLLQPEESVSFRADIEVAGQPLNHLRLAAHHGQLVVLFGHQVVAKGVMVQDIIDRPAAVNALQPHIHAVERVDEVELVYHALHLPRLQREPPAGLPPLRTEPATEGLGLFTDDTHGIAFHMNAGEADEHIGLDDCQVVKDAEQRQHIAQLLLCHLAPLGGRIEVY